MKILQLTWTALFMTVIILAGCSNHDAGNSKNEQPGSDQAKTVQEETNYIVLNDSMKRVLIKRGKEVSKITAGVLQKHLKAAVKEGDMPYAIKFCNSKAMELTDSVSKAESVIVRRLAKKYRNPLNETDSTESEIFKAYIIEWLGSKPLKPQIIPDEEGHPVFYNPIRVGTLCLNCHGTPGKNITPELEKTILELYPDDKAMGFKKGWLRGMWAITFPEYTVKQ
jgi:hypothetical protein